MSDYLSALVIVNMQAKSSTARPGFKAFLFGTAIIVIAVGYLFRQAWHPDFVVFSNDGPFGGFMPEHNRMPHILTGIWQDINWLGNSYPPPFPDFSTLIRLLVSPLLYAKFMAPFTLVFVGICAWLCFRLHGFSNLSCLLVGIAAALNSDFVNTSAWGVYNQTMGFGMAFLAVGALADTQSPRRWLRVTLAGFAVGIGINAAYEIGALFSIFVGIYVMVQSLVAEGPFVRRLLTGAARLAVVMIFAGIVAVMALDSLLVTQIKGIAGTERDAETKASRWSFATQYSLPKAETLGILVPGLYGFRFDTPDGGAYWGRAGGDLAWDDYFKSDKTGPPPRALLRAGAGSNYAGMLVVLLTVFAIAQSFRRQGGVLITSERRLVWFWSGVLLVAMLLMFGRFAPFYKFFYELPYISAIRNPAKFLHVVEWALLIVCAYGAEALWRTGFGPANVTVGVGTHWKNWWTKVTGFNRQWVFLSAMAIVIFALGWLVYASSRGALERKVAEYTILATGGGVSPAAAEADAKATARHSIRQVGRSWLFLVPAVGLVALAVSGYFSGRRTQVGVGIIATLLLIDLVPVNSYWIRTPNWKEKYESNSVIDFLKQRPYEQRVALFSPANYVDLNRLPREAMSALQQFNMFGQLYGAEWTQHLFKFHDVQTLDIVQEPRMATDKAAFEAVMSTASPTRRWELTNTKYLIGPTPFAQFLDQQLDGGRNRFRIALQFGLAAKPSAGRNGPTAEQITTVIGSNAPIALFDFTGALPRAQLYTNWKVSTNDPTVLQTWVKTIQQTPQLPKDMITALGAQTPGDLATLHELADPSFDPRQTVLLAEPLPVAPGTNQTPGEVKIDKYSSKHIVLSAKATAPSVLLLNDKYEDSVWNVTVNGKPTKVLRANYIVRGVFLDQAGDHKVEFKFQPRWRVIYISWIAFIAAWILLGYVIVNGRKEARAASGKASGG